MDQELAQEVLAAVAAAVAAADVVAVAVAAAGSSWFKNYSIRRQMLSDRSKSFLFCKQANKDDEWHRSQAT